VSFVNLGKHEISFKIVYYGPPLSGKTTNLEYIHKVIPPEVRGPMTVLSTSQDRTLFFDFLPVESTVIQGFTSKFQLYTVPGQPIYNETRRLVLRGTDGVVFVADSAWDRMEDNMESLRNLGENLHTHNMVLEDIPHILQYNKRDVADVAPTTYMDYLLNRTGRQVPSLESVATEGTGVFHSLNAIAKLVISRFITKHRLSVDQAVRQTRPAMCAEGAAA